MTQKKWEDIVAELGNIFPLEPEPGSKFPRLAQAIDDRINDLLKEEAIAKPSKVNKLYVEDLLRDCVTRVSNCITIRERAQDVETRALSDALHYKLQSAALSAHTAIAKILDPVSPRMGHHATSVSLTGTTATFAGENELWTKANTERDGLHKEMQDGLQILKSKAEATGNGSNYVERFAFLKRLFDLNMIECYRRSLVCATALKQIYGSDFPPVPTVKPAGYLDELAVWVQQASDMLDEELDSRYIGHMAFAVSGRTGADLLKHELLPRAKFDQLLPSGHIRFPINESPFKEAGMRDVLLRSVRLQVRTKDISLIRLWPVTVRLPLSVVTGKEEAFATIAPSAYESPDDAASVVRGVHNISPIGQWELELPEWSITGDQTIIAEVLNIYLFLGVSYRRV